MGENVWMSACSLCSFESIVCITLHDEFLKSTWQTTKQPKRSDPPFPKKTIQNKRTKTKLTPSKTVTVFLSRQNKQKRNQNNICKKQMNNYNHIKQTNGTQLPTTTHCHWNTINICNNQQNTAHFQILRMCDDPWSCNCLLIAGRKRLMHKASTHFRMTWKSCTLRSPFLQLSQTNYPTFLVILLFAKLIASKYSSLPKLYNLS